MKNPNSKFKIKNLKAQLIKPFIVFVIIVAIIKVVIVLVSLEPAKEKTRDARRQVDIREITVAMQKCQVDPGCGGGRPIL